MLRRDYSLTVNGLALHVTEWGRVDARPVVMLHGIRGYAETFAGVAHALQPDLRVIAYDQRGRGQSDWDPERRYDTKTYVADLLSVADQLGLQRFDLLGHSMGGINAIVFAAQNPTRVARLVIEDAGPGAFEASAGAERIKKELATMPECFDSWEAAADYMRAMRPSVTEEARQQRLHRMLKQLPDGTYTWMYDHAGIRDTRLNPDPDRLVDLRPLVPRIQCPTLVIRGARSDYLQPHMAQAMCDANPRLRWVEIPDAGHYIHDDQPETFNRHVKSFLQQSHGTSD